MQHDRAGCSTAQPWTKLMFTSVILSKIREYFRYRETVRELSRLSDRELEDIGVSRYQIDGVARGVAA